ncbi:MAG: tannase/feruloyl esterase family alpha/beta hydrolase [Alphaproteobacteria bacterium]|nr:tannase/feruloyl esterase family alpha/beta hydrolase [Alphaproteobacteria bacterium]
MAIFKRTGIHGLVAGAALASAAVAGATTARADDCMQLAANFHRPNTTITLAQTVPAGTFVPPAPPIEIIPGLPVAGPVSLPGLPQFCRIAGFTTPTSDSHIQFELWIPSTSWNLKYLQVGCGGLCGSISYTSMADPLIRGYAVAATDDGHEAGAGDASFAVGHPEKVIDFGYRSLKETTDVSKDLILAFERSAPQRSYFLGCSDGGREALMEAQRFPLDFDGIVAGSPANFWTHLFTGFLWNQVAQQSLPGAFLAQADMDTMSAAALAQCVGRDGGLSTDAFLNYPPACRFNPRTLPLSQDTVTAIERIFSGPPGIFPGYRLGEGEANVLLNWPAWISGDGIIPPGGGQGLLADAYFQDIVFPNSGWTPNTFSAAENARQADLRTGAILNSIDPDLHPFKLRGGKLIQYVGWSDSAISPRNDINYYTAVSDVMGGPQDTEDFYRMFMVPGMAHCGGGPGANAFGNGANGPNPSDPADDVLSALDHWVVDGAAPDEIVATKYVNDDPTQGIAFQRPLCTFPKISKYTGQGSTTVASSFACVRPDDIGELAGN